MARVTTKTGIANLTASLLKVNAVTSISPPDSNSKFATKAAQWYDEARRETLNDHIWNFAIKRVQLPAASETPAFGYGAKYMLPSDYIRVVSIGDEDDPETDYKIEDGYILSNLSAPLDLIYIYDQEDITKYTANFIQLFARKLGVYLAYDMTGNRSMVDTMEKAYQEKLSVAATVDGQESPPTHKIRRSKWRDAKEGRAVSRSYYQGRVVT